MTASAPEVPPVEPVTQPCPTCGAACKPGAKFCGKCGHAFTAPAPVLAAVDEPVADVVAPLVSAAPLDTPIEAPVVDEAAVVTAAAPVAEPPKVERPTPEPPRQATTSGRSGSKVLVVGAVASVLVLGVFAWWLTSRSSAPQADVAALPEPAAASSPASMPEVMAVPHEPVVEEAVPVVAPPATEPAPQEIIEHEPAAAPPRPSVDEAAQAQARRLKVEEEARQEQARREAQAQARQREQDKAKLNQANKTLDDLLK